MSRIIDLNIVRIKNKVVATIHPLQAFFLEINSTCNLSCKHCYIPIKDRQSILPIEMIKATLEEIKEGWGDSVGIAITGGEPLLHPEFNKIADLLKQYGFSWSLATNGLLVTKEVVEKIKDSGCNTITISLDGNEIDHEIQRNMSGIYAKVLDSIDMFVESNFPIIYITTTIHNGNIESLDHIYSLILNYKNNVKWRINPLLRCDSASKNNLNISKETYIRICDFVKGVEDELGITIVIGEKSELALRYGEYMYSDFDACFAGITTFGLLANGDIVNCMVCREKVLGNIYRNSSLKDIWDNQDTRVRGLCDRHVESSN